MISTPDVIRTKIMASQRVALFLDYDGTLAEFAPNPDVVLPDPELITLIEGLRDDDHFRIAIISGRKLDNVRKLLPVAEITIAGTYGIEILNPDGRVEWRADYHSIRPKIEQIRSQWQKLMAGSEEFYLEDKGWALAIHARLAGERSAEILLGEANEIAESALENASNFYIYRGERFFEVRPTEASKKSTVAFLMDHINIDETIPLYLGDDKNDEEAFSIVQAAQGIAIRIGGNAPTTRADWILPSPREAREWLSGLPSFFSNP
jgi:trehalose 6-phosphate phosphatase